MKTPEERLIRGKGNYINCTDYDDAIKAMKEYAIEYHDQFKQPTKQMVSIDENTLQKAINTWGIEAQTEMIKEECIELALALQKLNRNRGDIEEKERNIIDEIADVTIMIKQAHKIFSIDKINARIEYKMKRLEQRLIENVG